MPTRADVVADYVEKFMAMVPTVVDAGVRVTDTLPWADLADENIALMDTSFSLSKNTMGTNRSRLCEIRLELWLGSFLPGGDISKQPYVRRRVMEMIAAIETNLREIDPTLDYTVDEAELLEVAINGPEDADYTSEGAAIEGTATFLATVRIKTN
jgi:hypothetical protein